jgi:Ca2+-binding RTX toxin-like protein
MNPSSFHRVGTLLFLALAVVGTTTTLAASSNQVWADVFEGTEGPDVISGTPGNDLIDSKGGNDRNFGRSGDDMIESGEGDDANFGDVGFGNGSGNDIIFSGEGDDENYGDTLNDHEEPEHFEGTGDDMIVERVTTPIMEIPILVKVWEMT